MGFDGRVGKGATRAARHGEVIAALDEAWEQWEMRSEVVLDGRPRATVQPTREIRRQRHVNCGAPDPDTAGYPSMQPSVSDQVRPLDVLERLTEAFNSRDMAALTSLFHPNVEIRPTDEYHPPGTTYHGHDGLRSMLREAGRELPGAMLTLCRPRTRGDTIDACMCAFMPGEDEPRETYWRYTLDGPLIRRVEQLRAESEGRRMPREVLTPREREIFQMLAKGLRGPEIAARLVLSPETIRTHVQNGVQRLGARNRVQAVAIAVARGEINVP